MDLAPLSFKGRGLIRTPLGTSETKQRTLEEIAASFGDKVITSDKQGDGEDEDPDAKCNSERVEVVYDERA